MAFLHVAIEKEKKRNWWELLKDKYQRIKEECRETRDLEKSLRTGLKITIQVKISIIKKKNWWKVWRI